jgi:hypothetical protein
VSSSGGAIFQPAASKTGLLLYRYIVQSFTARCPIKTGGAMSLTTAKNPENCIFNL